MNTTTTSCEASNRAVAMRVRCPKCGEVERVPFEAIGRKAQCNRCKTVFRIAAPGSLPPATASAPPPLPVLPLPPLNGAPNPAAYASQQHLAPKAPPAQVRKRAVIGLFSGIALVVIGLAITIASYNTASDEGGTYYVLWGPVVFGAGLTLRSGYRLVAGAE